MPLYGRDVWKPRLIIAQIIVLQCTHYLAIGSIYGICNLLFGTRVSLHLFFAWEALTVASTSGWMAILIHCVAAVVGACALPLVVERAKKCWDFTFTFYFIHWVICVLYTSFPASWTWWLTTLVCIIIMSVGGEQLCMKAEMADINFGGSWLDNHNKKGSNVSNTDRRNKDSMNHGNAIQDHATGIALSTRTSSGTSAERRNSALIV